MKPGEVESLMSGMKGVTPDWMIPVGVGVVSGGSFPLTVNEEVDKKALQQVI